MAVETLTAEGLGYYPSAPSVIADRHRYYRTMRDEAPVLWSEELGGWMIARYEDVKSILRDVERFSALQGAGPTRRRAAAAHVVAVDANLAAVGFDESDQAADQG